MTQQPTTPAIQWLTRWGSEYKPSQNVREFASQMLGGPSVVRAFPSGKPFDIDLAKGTAKYQHQEPCSRCGGLGGGRQWAHTGWTCFECGGSGMGTVKTDKLYTAEKLAKLNATKAKSDAKRAEKAAAKAAQEAEIAAAAKAEFEAAHEQVIADLRACAEADGFLADVLQRYERTGKLSDKQIEAVSNTTQRILARRKAAEASQWVGEVGERIELTVTVEKVIDLAAGMSRQELYAMQFRPPIIYLCRDSEGNRIVYKGHGNFPGVDSGTAKIRAKVEEHTEYKGEKQTRVSRPKWLDEPKAEGPEWSHGPSTEEVQ